MNQKELTEVIYEFTSMYDINPYSKRFSKECARWIKQCERNNYTGPTTRYYKTQLEALKQTEAGDVVLLDNKNGFYINTTKYKKKKVIE